MSARRPHPADFIKGRPSAKTAWLAIVVALMALLPFLNATRGDFVYDDYNLIINHPGLQDLENWPAILTQGHYKGVGGYRPVVSLSFAANLSLGGQDPVGFHWTNLLLHALNAVLVLLVVRRLQNSTAVAFTAAILFAVHPVHTEAVSWISGRAELLAAFFFFLAWWLYLEGTAAARPWRTILWAESLVAFFAATLSKENALLFPLILVAGEVFRNRMTAQTQEKVMASPSSPLVPRIIMSVTPYFLVIGLYFLMRELLYSEGILRKAENIKSIDNVLVTAELWPRFMTAVSILADYVVLTLFPFHLSADYSFNQIPLETQFLNPRVWGSFLLLTLIGIFMILSWKKNRPSWFWIGFFFLMLGPVSNIAIVIGAIKADRFLYLPSFGLCVWLAYLAFGSAWWSEAPQSRSARRRLKHTRITVGAVVILFTLATWDRNPTWNSAQSLWAQTVKDAPNSAKAHANLGTALLNRGENARSIPHFERTIEIDPLYSGAYLNLGAIHMASRQPEKAEKILREGLAQNPNNGPLYLNLGVLLGGLGKKQEASDAFAKAVELEPDNAIALYNYGLSLALLDRTEEARPIYQRALRRNPRYLEAHHSLAMLDFKRGHIDQARSRLKFVLNLDPSFQLARQGLRYIDSQRAQEQSP